MEMPSSKLSLADDHLVLDFPYDAEQIAEVRSVDGCKWDKVNRVWRAPVTSLHAVRGVAAAPACAIDTDVLLLTIPAHRIQAKRIYVKDGFIHLSFAYDRVAITSVKQIAGITWDKDTKAWKTPMTSVDEVIRWGDMFGVEIDPAVAREASEVQARLDATREASRATDADIEIPNMIGALFPYQRAGVAYAVAARRCFIADDMGLGKTLQSSGTLE